MKTARAVLVVLGLTLVSSQLVASGQVGIFAVISKVVFEPNDRSPERMQLWGAFTLVDGGVNSNGKTLTPRRGYMYFTLPPAGPAREAALKEWADFKSVAGSGQAVAFGSIGYIGAFSDELISRPAGMPPYLLLEGAQVPGMYGSRNVLRAESVMPAAPDNYPLNMGLVKFSNTGNQSSIVNQLQQLAKQ